MANLIYHRKNEIAVDCTDVENISAIDIYYSGTMYAESSLPNDWQIFSNKSRIMCLSLGDSVPELLLEYSGKIRISGATFIDKSLKKHNVGIVVEDIDYWEKSLSKWATNDQNWEVLGNIHESSRGLNHTSIITNNLLAKNGEFFFFDGTPYEGSYHQHGDGQAMTGEEHSEESEFIYRKYSTGKLYNPRKKLSAGIKHQLSASVPRTINRLRKSTASADENIKLAEVKPFARKKMINTKNIKRAKKGY